MKSQQKQKLKKQYKLAEFEIQEIFRAKKLKIDGKIYNFNSSAINKIRQLFKKSKYYK